MATLTTSQQTAVTADANVMLLGNAGTGKTTALHHRLIYLLQSGVSAYNILTLVTEYGQEQPYLQLLHQSDIGAYADLNLTTYNSLAREMVTLFWPLIARQAGFHQPHKPPTFLEYDMAQILMWRILTPIQQAGGFAHLRLRPQRLVSQLIDILNRAAFNGLTITKALERQARIFQHEPDKLQNLSDATEAVHAFREFCLANSLLDFSLTIELFDTYLVKHEEFHRYFQERYTHILVDNIEENTAVAQNFIRQQMQSDSVITIAYDTGGGYRRFLSADPTGADKFRQHCQVIDFVTTPFTSNLPLQHISHQVSNFLTINRERPTDQASQAIWQVLKTRYRRDMLSALPATLLDLIEVQNIPPHEIALVAPYLDGALRYALRQELSHHNIPYRLLRRRISPREEPLIRAWLTWLTLAHPDWQVPPVPFDVEEALTLSLQSLDPARAALAVTHLYDANAGILQPATNLDDILLNRIGHNTIDQIERIRQWLQIHSGQLPIDTFIFRLFNDLLVQSPFQIDPTHAESAAAVCDYLVRLATNVRRSATSIGLTTPAEIGQALLAGIYQGLVTANPPDLGDPPDPNGVVIATTYSYLLSGISSHVQVWLDAGITGWWQTPFQPLSNAFVMVESREPDKLWTAQEEIDNRNELLSYVVHGLTNRCTGGIVLAYSDLDRSGQRQSGQLWRALLPICPPTDYL